MSTTIAHEVEAVAPEPAKRSRPRWLRPAVIAIALILIVTIVGLDAWADNYTPLRQGSTYGAPIGAAKAVTDGLQGRTAIILTGPPGSSGGEMASVSNSGRYAVKILGEPFDGTKYTWGPGDPATRSLGQSLAASRPFPVTLYPGQEIQVFITQTKPDSCRGATGGLAFDFTLTYEAFGFHHTYYLSRPGGPGSAVPISACPPAPAFQHLAH